MPARQSLPAESSAGPPYSNQLINMLPRGGRARLLAECERVELQFGEVLQQPGKRIRQVYFPTNSFVSKLVTRGEDGEHGEGGELEVGLAGNEGMWGLAVVLGSFVSRERILVQGGGPAWRIGVPAFRREWARNHALRRVLDRYTLVLMAQLSQAVVCATFHPVKQRMARWLLMTRDRAHSDEFDLTHAFLASMLGVRRVGVTEAAGELQAQGLIHYTRGRLQVLDRKGLEAAACSCHHADRTTYDQLLG